MSIITPTNEPRILDADDERVKRTVVENFPKRKPSRPLDITLMTFCILPAIALMTLIAGCNVLVFRSVRRAFFRQERVGLHGKVFTLIKFRTMYDGTRSDGTPLTDQERVTRFGRFLRNTHLDELPQLWNILAGDMSFLGPRPEMISAHIWATGLIPEFPMRLQVRPGITGLAQITQGYTTMEEERYRRKLKIDLRYVETRSFALDCRILVGTAIWMVRGRGWQWNVLAPSVPTVSLDVQDQPKAESQEEFKRAA